MSLTKTVTVIMSLLTLTMAFVMMSSSPMEACGCDWKVVKTAEQLVNDVMDLYMMCAEQFIIDVTQTPPVTWAIIVPGVLLLVWAIYVLMDVLDKRDSVKKAAGPLGKAKNDNSIFNIQDRGEDMV